MIAFINTFLSYLLVVIIFAIIAVCGVLIGKKLRDSKDAKIANAEANTESVKGEE